MDITELNEACKRLARAWAAFGISLQEAVQAFSEAFNDVIEETGSKFEEFLEHLKREAKKPQKPNGVPPIKYHKRDYLHNQNISVYRVNKKVQKNLPYQHRNY